MTEIETSPMTNGTSSYVKLKDDEFIESAGLDRTGNSGRKSNAEKLLEQSLNTTGGDESTETSPSKQVKMSNGLDTSLQVGVKTTPERPQNLKSDQFIQDAGLARTGRVARKSSMERLLEDTLQTAEPEVNGDTTSERNPLQRASTTAGESPATIDHSPLQRAATISVDNSLNSPTTPTSDSENSRRFSSASSGDETAKPKTKGRKSSIYEQKQIEAPTAVVGNRIASRTNNLFKQYEKDISSHEVKPLVNVNAGGETSATRRKSYERAASIDDKTKVDLAREQKEKELEEIRLAYQQRLLDEEQEEERERIQRRQNQELKYSRGSGDVKGRYMSVAVGDAAQENDSDGEVEALVDKNGVPIQKSGGREKVVKSSNSIGDIKARFGSMSTSSWKKPTQESDTNAVDAGSVSSARNMFKNFEQKKGGDDQKSFNRPTVKKRDPKELMEQRKKATYGDDDEDIQDGVVKKSVVIDESELAQANRQEALNKYKELESSAQNNDQSPANKPKNRLLSDNEAKLDMNKRSDSLSGSEPGDITQEVTVDVSGDVSGYEGSVSPCSPNSEISDDYISDTPRDEKVIDDDEAFQSDEVNEEVY